MRYKIRNQFRRIRTLLVVLVLVVVALVPVFEAGIAQAISYGLITSRSIEMSDSTASATGVTYTVSFTNATTSTVAGIVVEFCDETPIIGDTTCTKPAGFSVGTPTVTGQSSNISTLTTAASANSGRTLELSGTGASVTAPAAISFNITTVTNPSTTNHSFYARIYTYASAAGATGYTLADPTAGAAVVDAGGIALSTANNITITAKVQETLTFCVYTGANCAAGGSTVALGDNHGVLSTSGPFVDKTTKYDVATNASSGAIVRVKGDTLKSGSFSITATGSGALSIPATSQFGLCSYESTGTNLTVSTSPTNYSGVTGGTCLGTTQSAGTGTPGGANGATYAFNTAGTNTTYGEQLATEVAGASSTGVIAFLGNIAATQQAGIYTTTLIFIATGTY